MTAVGRIFRTSPCHRLVVALLAMRQRQPGHLGDRHPAERDGRQGAVRRFARGMLAGGMLLALASCGSEEGFGGSVGSPEGFPIDLGTPLYPLDGRWKLTVRQSGASDCPGGGADITGDGRPDTEGVGLLVIGGLGLGAFEGTLKFGRTLDVYGAIAASRGQFELFISDGSEVQVFQSLDLNGSFTSENEAGGTSVLTTLGPPTGTACTVPFDFHLSRR